MVHFLIGIATALLVVNATAAESVYRASPNNYRRSIGLLRPGDTLMLAAGAYSDGLPVRNLSGEPGRPITISGRRRGAPATFIAREGRNTVSIVDSRYVVIRNLVLEGRKLAVDAVKAEGHSGWAHDITLENLVIRGYGNNQQMVGISTKCPAWNWVVRGNTILGAGTGMYLGNSDGSAPFVAGLIERNLIVETVGYNLQIKHRRSRPDIPGMPVGASATIIRHNVFAKPEAGSTESMRPNVLVGHFPPEGPGAEDDYVVYGNFFYQNRHEALFQGEGNVVALAGGSQTDNVAAPLSDAGTFLNHPFAPLGQLDLFPRRGLAGKESTGAHLPEPFPDWEKDFNGRVRVPGSIGAYSRGGKNPGWLPRLVLKPE